MEIYQQILTPPLPSSADAVVRLPFKVTQSHWNRHGYIGCLLFPMCSIVTIALSHTISEINGDICITFLLTPPLTALRGFHLDFFLSAVGNILIFKVEKVMQQLSFDSDSTVVRLPLDCDSAAIQL